MNYLNNHHNQTAAHASQKTRQKFLRKREFESLLIAYRTSASVDIEKLQKVKTINYII